MYKRFGPGVPNERTSKSGPAQCRGPFFDRPIIDSRAPRARPWRPGHSRSARYGAGLFRRPRVRGELQASRAGGAVPFEPDGLCVFRRQSSPLEKTCRGSVDGRGVWQRPRPNRRRRIRRDSRSARLTQLVVESRARDFILDRAVCGPFPTSKRHLLWNPTTFRRADFFDGKTATRHAGPGREPGAGYSPVLFWPAGLLKQKRAYKVDVVLGGIPFDPSGASPSTAAVGKPARALACRWRPVRG